MSKTFTYVLFVIGVYLLVIFPKSKSTSSGSNTVSEEMKNKIEEGADAVIETGNQISIRAGYTT